MSVMSMCAYSTYYSCSMRDGEQKNLLYTAAAHLFCLVYRGWMAPIFRKLTIDLSHLDPAPD